MKLTAEHAAAIQRCTMTLNADPVTVDGKRCSPGALFLQSISTHPDDDGEWHTPIGWCRPASDVPLPGMYASEPWPDWLELEMNERG